jgi:hypothetical protein
MKVLFTILFFSSLIAFSFPDDKVISSKPSYYAIKTDKTIKISGKLDDPEWEKANPIELPYEAEPGENIKAPQRTIAMTLYNNEYLYIGFKCYDTNTSQIRANLTERDKIFSDDFVIVLIDTYGDHQKAYEFAVNPFGIQGDLMRTANNEDSNFDIIWFSAAARNDSGWTVEMAIPFKSLRFSNKSEQEWTVIFGRIYPRASRSLLTSIPLDRNNPSLLSQGGILYGIKNIKSSGSLEILPYILGQASGNLNDDENVNSGFTNKPFKGRIGGGIQYSPNTSFSLDAVFNPDFSQIESDADQISVNTTFALSYPEKRPFFLIGQEHFQTPMFYSRSINNPIGAGRIIGKSGSLTYVYLGALDRNTPFIIPGEEESNTIESSIKSFANIGRLRYDFGDEIYFGGMVLTRNFSDGYNYIAGFDWNYKFWKNWNFSGEGYISNTKEINDLELLDSDRKFGSTEYTAKLDGEKYSGNGIHLYLSHSERNYYFGFEFNDFSPTYQTYNGIFPENNYRQGYTQHDINIYPLNSLIDKIQIRLPAGLKFNYDGLKREQFFEPGINVALKSQTSINLSYLLINDEVFKQKLFKKINRIRFNINANPSNGFSGYAYGQFGRFIHRDDNPSMGSGHSFGLGITIKPESKLKIDISFDRARLSDIETKELFYDGYLFRTAIVYQFISEIFFRTIIQYNSFDNSLNIYPLFSYKLNAFSTFYAGSTNNFIDYGQEYGFKTSERQYFIKFQYLLSMR